MSAEENKTELTPEEKWGVVRVDEWEDSWEVNPDVVEVVRCKDCKHKYCDGNQIICQKLYWCDGSNFEPAAEDFCSHGERREDVGSGNE